MKKILLVLVITVFLVIVIVQLLNYHIQSSTKQFTFSLADNVPSCYTALVLGAHVSRTGVPSVFLKDRLDMAFNLYKLGKVKRLLLSGDHGQKDYDEVNNMRIYLINRGINSKDIFLDHAGFDTYNSIIRAKEIFGVDDMIIVSQEFHLPRALFIAIQKGHRAFGIKADKTPYGSIDNLLLREKLADVKAVMELIFNKRPKFLGEKIPITGDSQLSYDRYK